MNWRRQVIGDAMDRVISYLTIIVLSTLPVAGRVIQQDCTFAGTPTTIRVSETLGRNVCIRLADTDPLRSVGAWHFIACQNANTFRIRGESGNADLCRNHNGEPGIGVDFSAKATVRHLELACENSSGTTMEVIDVYIRPNGSIIYVPQSLDNKIDVTTGNTAVIAKFIGLLEDLELIRIPDGVQCNSTAEPDNCRLAAFNGGSEFTMTCRVTPQMMNDGGVRNFSVPGGAVLASVYVNVRPNTTEVPPTTAPPTQLDVGGIVGIILGVLGLLLVLILVVVLIIVFIYIVWRVGPGVSPQQGGDQERGEIPPSHFSYVAFGEGIPEAVKSSIVSNSNLEEFRLNGTSVEDRFGRGSERFLFVTKSSEYEATNPSGNRESSLTAQLRQLATGPGNRVHVVQLPDAVLGETGQLNTDGESPVIAFINDSLQGQPCTPVQRQTSTDSRILASIYPILQSMHKMLFRGLPTATNVVDGEPNGHLPAGGGGDADDGL